MGFYNSQWPRHVWKAVGKDFKNIYIHINYGKVKQTLSSLFSLNDTILVYPLVSYWIYLMNIFKIHKKWDLSYWSFFKHLHFSTLSSGQNVNKIILAYKACSIVSYKMIWIEGVVKLHRNTNWMCLILLEHELQHIYREY